MVLGRNMAGKGRGKAIDLTGQRFTRWVVIKRIGSTKYNIATWECKCDCGRVRVIDSQSLRHGRSQSCGCLLKEKTIERNIKRGEINRTKKYFNHKGWLRNQLRRISRKWPPWYETIKEARVERGKYRCAGYGCNSHIIGAKQKHVDHIVPIGELKDWDTWIRKLFCDKSNLQLLCEDCHKKKTAEERQKRNDKN